MNKLLPLLLSIFLGISLIACTSLGDIYGPDTVITTSDQLRPGEEAVVIDRDQLPAEVVAQLPEGVEFVAAKKEQLIPEAEAIAADDVPAEKTNKSLEDTALGLLNTFIPAFAGWEAVVTLFSQRKRKAYGRVVKAVVPTDKNINLGEAVVALGAALGISHTSEASKLAAEQEPVTNTSEEEVLEG